MADGMQRDWRELCAAVANESDTTKLSSLVQELIEALDKRKRGWRRSVRLSASPVEEAPAASADAVRRLRQ